MIVIEMLIYLLADFGDGYLEALVLNPTEAHTTLIVFGFKFAIATSVVNRTNRKLISAAF